MSYVEDIVHVDWKDLKNQIPKLKYFHFVFIKKKAKEIVEKEASHNFTVAQRFLFFVFLDVLMFYRPIATVAKRETAGPHIYLVSSSAL